jgi:membrane protein DedA with SNARE-associated domain
VFDASVLSQYFLIFALLLAAGLGFPIPEEIPVVVGGGLAAHPENGVVWWIMLPICILGVVIGDGFLYTIGRVCGPPLLQNRFIRSRLLPPQRYREIQENFHKYGVKILLFARLLPGIRSPIFVTAGIMHLPFTKFLLADSIYAVPGVSLLFFLGYWFTDQFLEIVKRVESLRPLIVLLVLVAVASYLVYHFLNRPVTTGDPHEIPLVGEVADHLTESKQVPHVGEAARARAAAATDGQNVAPVPETRPAPPA